MTTTLPAYSIITEGRVRRSCGSLEWQTAQSQPSVGTPMDVPLPSTVRVAFTREPFCSSSAGTRGGSGLRRTRQRIRHFHLSHAHLVKTVLQKGLFRGRQVALGFFRQKRERVNGLPRSDDVEPGLLTLLMHQS